MGARGPEPGPPVLRPWRLYDAFANRIPRFVAPFPTIVSENHQILLANLFHRYKAEISAELLQASVPSMK